MMQAPPSRMDDGMMWQVLLVEDDEEDYLITRGMLEETRGSLVQVQWVQTPEDALRVIASSRPDVILVDYQLGMTSGVEFVRHAVDLGCRSPIVLLTGHGSYEIDVEAMQAGAADYLLKNEVNASLLERTLRYAIERSRLLEQNLQQKELLETIFSLDPGSLAVITGPELRVEYANPAFRSILPDSSIEPVGQTMSELFPTEQGFKAPVNMHRMMTTGEPLDILRFEAPYPSGKRYFNIYLRSIFWQGEPAMLLVLLEITDIEEARVQLQRAAQEAVKRAEELNLVLGQLEDERARLNEIITHAPSGIVLVDAQARIILSNAMADLIYARPVPYGQPYESHAVLGIHQLNGAPIDPIDLPLTRSALYGEVHNNVEIMIIWPNGERRFVLTNTTPLRDHAGSLAGAVAVFNDITEHKQAEEAVRRSMAQLEVQRHLMQSREKERLRIAQDLHDGPLQGLVGMTFEIKDILGEAADHPLASRLRDLADTLQNQIREIRAFSQQLRPPVLTPFGLEKAIRSHAETFQESHPELEMTYHLDPDGRMLNEEVRLALFRIYQELLNNILRHAKATEVEVSLSLQPEKVILEVRDNGCGFNVPSSWVEMARQGHLGLVGVQERASSVNGFVEILSAPGKGSQVRVTVPLS